MQNSVFTNSEIVILHRTDHQECDVYREHVCITVQNV